MKFKFNSENYIFKPKLVPLIAFIFAFAILISLTSWQIYRLNWKTQLINERILRFESEVVDLASINSPIENEFSKVFVTGELLNEYELFMPAISKNGNNGFHIIVPLKISEDKAIIFDTGWIPLKIKQKSERLNNIQHGEKKFEAVIRMPGRKGYFQPENDPVKNFWFFVQPDLMEKTIGKIDLEKSFYLEAVKNGPNGYPLGNQTRIYLRNNHLQYAITWLLITFGLVGVFFFASIRRN